MSDSHKSFEKLNKMINSANMPNFLNNDRENIKKEEEIRKRIISKLNLTNKNYNSFSQINIFDVDLKREAIKAEIEKRYNKSINNKNYKFPKKIDNISDSESENSMENIYIYNLNTQNSKNVYKNFYDHISNENFNKTKSNQLLNQINFAKVKLKNNKIVNKFTNPTVRNFINHNTISQKFIIENQLSPKSKNCEQKQKSLSSFK